MTAATLIRKEMGCDISWCVRHTGPGHLDVAALQRSLDRFVARHSALRTRQSPDEPVREPIDTVAAMWQLWTSCFGNSGRRWQLLSHVVGSAIFACWTRTFVRSPNEARQARQVLKRPLGSKVRDDCWDFASHDDYVHSVMKGLTCDHRWPFDAAVVPLYHGVPDGPPGANAVELALTLPLESVAWYIYLGITHAYSDGASVQALYGDSASVQALYGDLIHLYEEEMGQVERELREAPEHLALLQQRLWPSLCGRLPGTSDANNDANNDVHHEIVCEGRGRRPFFSSRIFLGPTVMRALCTAAIDVLGCGIDIAWLIAVIGAMFRLFPELPCIYLMLKVVCRDGPDEVQMVGFLREQRVLPVDIGDPRTATLLDIASTIVAARQAGVGAKWMPLSTGHSATRRERYRVELAHERAWPLSTTESSRRAATDWRVSHSATRVTTEAL